MVTSDISSGRNFIKLVGRRIVLHVILRSGIKQHSLISKWINRVDSTRTYGAVKGCITSLSPVVGLPLKHQG